MRSALNDAAGLLHFGELERRGSGDVDEDAARAVDRAGFEQWRSNRFLRCFDRALGPASGRRAHDRVSHARHDRLHVGKVAIDDAGDRDDVGDALHALAQNVVGDAEGFEEARVFGDG